MYLLALFLLLVLQQQQTLATCVDLGLEQRACSQIQPDGSTLLADFDVRCNTSTNLYDVINTTRCGDLPIVFCRNGRSVQSFCQYDSSCDVVNGPLDNNVLITAGPSTTKTVNCQGLALALQYTFDSVAGTCAYSIDTTLDPVINQTLIMRIPSIQAKEVWSYDPGTSGSFTLHRTVPQGSSMSALCLDLKAVATRTQFQCVDPYISLNGQFCALGSLINFKCNTLDVRCDLSVNDDYTCSVAGPTDRLVSSCATISVTDVARMLHEYQRMQILGLDDVADLPIDELNGHPFPACTEMALTCNGYFNCSSPYVPPSLTSSINSSFCELPASHTQVPVTCFGEQIICFSQESQNSTHECIYDAGFLTMDCFINGTRLADMYTLAAEIQEFFTNCSNDNTCDLSHFQRLATFQSRSLFAMVEEEKENKEYDWTTPALQHLFWTASLQPGSSYKPRSVPVLSLIMTHQSAPFNQDHVFLPWAGLVRKQEVSAPIRGLFQLEEQAHPVVVIPDSRLAAKHQTLMSFFDDEYAILSSELDSAESATCSMFLNQCNATELFCRDQQLLTSLQIKSRETFCTGLLAASCQNFTGTMPQNVTRFPVCTDACLTEQYMIRCPKTTSPLPNFADPTHTSDSAFHNIFCSKVTTSGQCYYECFVNSAQLQFYAFPVPGSILLNPMLTGTASGERYKCAAVMAIAQDTSSSPNNYFICSGGYQTTYTTVVNTFTGTNTTVVKDICVTGEEPDVVQLNCGELLVTCSRITLSTNFVCSSDTWACANNGTCAHNLPYLYAPIVSPSILFLGVSVSQRCVLIRDQAAQNFSCPLTGACVANQAANCTRVNTPSVFCTPNVSIDTAPPVVTFACGQELWTNVTVHITCIFNANESDYSCSRAYTTAELAELSKGGFPTSPPPLSMSCSSVDAFGLVFLYGPSTLGAVDLAQTNVSTPTKLARNRNRCLLVKRSCTAPGDVFSCNCNFLQDTTHGQFCDAPQLTEGELGSILFEEVNVTVQCGSLPRHIITCSNSPNSTGTKFGRWSGCTADSGPFRLSCMVPTPSLLASRTDNSSCELLRELCQTPVTCDPDTDCECPVYPADAPALFACNYPAAVCRGRLCQYQTPGDTSGPNATDIMLGNQICDYQPERINLTCTDGPGTVLDLRLGQTISMPSYNLTCAKQVVGALFAQLVQYDCVCANPDEDDACGPATQRMRLNVTVPARTLLYQANDSAMTCHALGQEAVSSSALACDGPFVSTFEQPWCSSPTDDPFATLGRFTCDGLLITCVPGPNDINTVRCYSDPDSINWQLGASKDPLCFPNPLNLTGCILGSSCVPSVSRTSGLVLPNFYTNQGQRCTDILTNCFHSCLAQNSGESAINPNIEVSSEALNISICRAYLQGRREFQCDGQDILCTPQPIQDSDVNASQPLIDADSKRTAQTMTCVQGNQNSSLEMNCPVSLFAFTRNPDVCSTLLSECSRNLGHITCLGDYFRSEEHPFCTERFEASAAARACDCSMWWSEAEGTGLTPKGLPDTSCYNYDAINALRGSRPTTRAEDTATDPDAGPVLVTADVREACNKSQLWEADTLGPVGLSCDLRGFLGYDTYLRRLYGVDYQHVAEQVYSVQGHKQRRYWCVWSFVDPRVVCATKAGMGVPLCTVECPVGLVETSVRGSRTRYCCQDPESCTDLDDTRNCVLGRHDAVCNSTLVERPWACALNNPLLTHNFTGLETVLVLVQSQNVSVVPSRTCPANPLNSWSAFPLPQGGAKQQDQIRSMIHHDLWTHGYVVTTDADTQIRGLYITRRPSQFRYYPNPTTATQYRSTQVLRSLDPTRRHDLDRENIYLGHPVPDSAILWTATELEFAASTLAPQFSAATTYFLERTLGQDCSDMLFNAYDYLVGSAGAMARALDRRNARWAQYGADHQLLLDMDFSNAARREPMRLDSRELDLVVVNSTVTFPNLKFLQSNLLQEISIDLQLGLTLDGQPRETNATFEVIDSVMTCTSGCESLGDDAFWRQHTSFEAVRYRIPIFGDRQRRSDFTVDITEGGVAKVKVGLSGNDPLRTYVVGYVTLPLGVTSVAWPNFWYDLWYWAWRDLTVYGGVHTRDWSKPGPSARCALNTPMYKPGILTPDQKQLCGFNSALCPLPVPSTWDWRLDNGSDFRTLLSFADPPLSMIPADLLGVPCSSDHGVCRSSPATAPGGGTCSCYASFQVATNLLSGGALRPPSSLVVRGCEVDIRGLCTDISQGIGVVCAGHGRCVSDFANNKQTAKCRCGGFPNNCDRTTPRSCEPRGLTWVEGPYVLGDFANQFCSEPRTNCRTVGFWDRPQPEFFRGNSESCEIPAINSNTAYKYGDCIIDPVGLAANEGNYAADDAWYCRCRTGHYGRTCSYLTLANKCFDPDTERQFLSVGEVRSSVTDCAWNRHLNRWELVIQSQLGPVDLAAAPRSRCRGVACSGHGTCTHVGKDVPLAERWELQPNATLTFETPAEVAFSNQALGRIMNQTCVCDSGWTGPLCTLRTCPAGCGFNGTCDPATGTCVCPRDAFGRLLVTGAQCDGVVCFGRGHLNRTTTGAFTCMCDPPYFQQGSKEICSGFCDCADACSLSGKGPPVTLMAELYGSIQTATCRCGTGLGTRILCSSKLR